MGIKYTYICDLCLAESSDDSKAWRLFTSRGVDGRPAPVPDPGSAAFLSGLCICPTCLSKIRDRSFSK